MIGIKAAGQLVVVEGGIDHHAQLGVHHAAFVESHADRLDHPAVDLAFGS
jgi:hypothetical protein